MANIINNDENFEELFAQFMSDDPKEGSIVQGKVIDIRKDVVVIDIGLKTEGLLPLKEFASYGEQADIAIGDTIEVFLERIENNKGYAVLSREKALRDKSWHILEKSLENKENIDGVIVAKGKNGYKVDLNGITAFLPGSHVDFRPVKDINVLFNIKQPFKILHMDKKLGSIVVSRRLILEEARAEEREEMLSQISEGQILEGTVKNITDYGVFVDLGKVDGLLHVTDISWRRISHPSEVLSLNQKITVMVIKFHEDSRRVSLGMKQLQKNPWEGIEARFPKNQRFKGKITNITDYGAFIELEPGIEGLVHVSEISWNKTTLHPKKLVSVGDETDFMVLDIDPSKHRISLGIKQCSENPWAEFAKSNPADSIVTGQIKNVVEFGIFVGFNEYVDGLVHISDVSWGGDSAAKLSDYSKGKDVTVKILSIDIEKERISLGIKQLQYDPFENLLQSISKKSVIEVTVKKIDQDGITVELAPEFTSYIPKSDISSDKNLQKTDKFNLEDKIEVLVNNIDKEARTVKLSIKNLELEEQKKIMNEYSNNDSGSKVSNLGDLLDEAINHKNNKK